MAKIKFILENEQLGKESIEADGVVYTLFRIDPLTNQSQLRLGASGQMKNGVFLANMLASTRNYVMEVLGVKEDQEDLFDNTIKQACDAFRNNKPEI